MAKQTLIETNKAIVIAVSERGCKVAVNGHNTDITWDDLEEAATQDVYCGQTIDETTRELACFYRSIQERARQMVAGNRSLPIFVTVHQDSTHVWWVASFADVSGAWGWLPRAADEGGTLAHEWMAEREAERRSEGLRKLGYTVRCARG